MTNKIVTDIPKKRLPRSGAGRPKGSVNKTTAALKDMILLALEGAHAKGGIGYLKKQADENPTAFLTLVGKVLPLQVNASVGIDADLAEWFNRRS